MQFQSAIGRSIFTTAAALASAYYAVALGTWTYTINHFRLRPELIVNIVHGC